MPGGHLLEVRPLLNFPAQFFGLGPGFFVGQRLVLRSVVAEEMVGGFRTDDQPAASHHVIAGGMFPVIALDLLGRDRHFLLQLLFRHSPEQALLEELQNLFPIFIIFDWQSPHLVFVQLGLELSDGLPDFRGERPSRACPLPG